MLPSALTILSFILMALAITFVPLIIPKKFGVIIEIALVIASLVYLFVAYSFTEAMMLMSFMAITYGNMGTLINQAKWKKRLQLKQTLHHNDYEEIQQRKTMKRLLMDILLTFFVSVVAILFLLFAPDMYMLLKFFIGIGLIAVAIQLISRIGNFLTTEVYFLPELEQLVILSLFESRELPLHDIKDVHRESTSDLLKLHPLFTFLSEKLDYTVSFQPVLKLSFPGETVYFTPDYIERWQSLFTTYVEEKEAEEKFVLPLWHPQNLKRLFWKGYFAVTVKGISAYTGLLLILFTLDAPSYLIIIFVFVWWLFNLYVSDRVLIAGADAVELTEGEIYDEAQRIFQKAGIPTTKLYLIDSPVHNGLATGMNIGRGTIMLTKATTQLSLGTVKAILAHEAIHIKKRDVLINQMARMLFFVVLGGLVYLFFDEITMLADHLFLWIVCFYLLMMLFPMYLSFIAQWTEIRADYLGAKLLEKGRPQMAVGLRELGMAQDQSLAKTREYSLVDDKPMKQTSNVERDNWFFRFIEFQIQPHPPLYWRIQSLLKTSSWAWTLKNWLGARFKESLPDWMRKHGNSRKR